MLDGMLVCQYANPNPMLPVFATSSYMYDTGYSLRFWYLPLWFGIAIFVFESIPYLRAHA